MPRAVVTGGAGFVGSHCVTELVARGWDVVAVDNFVTGRRENVTHLRHEPRFTLVEHDATLPFPGAVTRMTFDAVLHLASPASPPSYLAHPLETLAVGAEGTRVALELARRDGARFLLASTSEVYGDPLVHPQVESYWGHVNPVGPRSVYDEAKRYAEALTMAYHRVHGLDTKIARIFNTYGPRMAPGDGRVVTNFIEQATSGRPLTVYGDGSQTRSFCWIDDLVTGMLLLLESTWVGPMNLGNPDECTVLELAKLVLEITGSTSPIALAPLPDDDPARRRPDISLAAEHLGWQPTVDVRDGLTRLVEWYRRTRG